MQSLRQTLAEAADYWYVPRLRRGPDPGHIQLQNQVKISLNSIQKLLSLPLESCTFAAPSPAPSIGFIRDLFE